jgi:hypothetical protein
VYETECSRLVSALTFASPRWFGFRGPGRQASIGGQIIEQQLGHRIVCCSIGDAAAIIEEIDIQTIFMRFREPVRRMLVNDGLRVRQLRRGLLNRGFDRDNLIIVAVNDERRKVHAREIRRRVGLGEGFNALVDADEAREHGLLPKAVAKS